MPRKPDLPHFAGVFEPTWDPVLRPKRDPLAKLANVCTWAVVFAVIFWAGAMIAQAIFGPA